MNIFKPFTCSGRTHLASIGFLEDRSSKYMNVRYYSAFVGG